MIKDFMRFCVFSCHLERSCLWMFLFDCMASHHSCFIRCPQ